MKRYEWPAFVWTYADSEAEARAMVDEWKGGASMGDVTVSLDDSPPTVGEDEDEEDLC